jgi:hypothetical protein
VGRLKQGLFLSSENQFLLPLQPLIPTQPHSHFLPLWPMPTNSSTYINEKIFLSSVESITHPHKHCARNGTSCILKARYVNLVFSLLLLTRVLRYRFSTQTRFPSWGFWFITPGFVICLVYLMGVQEIQGGSWFGSFCV